MRTLLDEKKFKVLFLTARRTIYSGPVRSVALHFADGTLDVLPPRRRYFTSFTNCEIILRTSKGTIKHQVTSGTANLKTGALKIVAELKDEVPGKAAVNRKKCDALRSRSNNIRH